MMSKNNQICPIESEPWIQGLIDGLSAANLILNSKLESKNRLALILLDSTLEIAFKDYLLYVRGFKNLKKEVLQNRDNLHKIVRKHTNFEKNVWESLQYFYVKRCDLYHEDAGKTLTDKGVFDFFNIVILVCDSLFDMDARGSLVSPESLTTPLEVKKIPLNGLATKKEVIMAVVGRFKCKDTSEIAKKIKRSGYKRPLKPSEISTYLRTYPHVFYFDSTADSWILTDEAQDEYYTLASKYGGKENE